MFINPKTDFAFKKIFGSQQSTDILISFLNAILYEGEPTIVDLEIIDPYQSSRIQGLKDSFLDVKAKLCDRTTVIIEMQVVNVVGFEKRVLYNAAKFYATQLDVGKSYTLLNPVIALTIVDFKMFSTSNKVISTFTMRERDDMTSYCDDIKLVFIELPKFQKTLENLDSLSDKWIYFLSNANKLQSVPSNMEVEPAIQHAFRMAEQSQLSRDELETLERQSMVLNDNINSILYAKQEGQQEGRLEGQRSLLLRLLNRLFGELPIALQSQIDRLSVPELENLGEALLDFSSIADLTTWLENHSS